MPPQAQTGTLPSVKDLASSEASLRRACLSNITTFLDERSPLSPLNPTECLQLWRGFYVALYMHDSKNALSVQGLITDLAKTLKTMDDKDWLLADNGDSQHRVWLETWTTAFWETICREWPNIDQWRMNKVLLLVRFFLREQFRLLFDRAVNDSADAKKVAMAQIITLEAWPLSPRERKVPDGLRLHVLDVWVDELTTQRSAAKKLVDEGHGADVESKKSLLIDIAKDLIEPIRKLSKEALSKGVRNRAKETTQAVAETLQ